MGEPNQPDFLHGLGEADRTAVLSAGRPVTYQPGESLFHQDDPASGAFMLSKGRARLVQHTPDGRQVILRVINPGEVIGLVSVLESSNYPSTVETMEPSEGVRWDGETLQALFERFPRLALNVIPYLIARVHDVQARYRELATERVERRVARVLLRLVSQAGEKTAEGVRINMRLTRQDLADMTGTTLFSVSRILAAWEQKGWLDGDRTSIRLRDPHAIVAIAEEMT